MTCTRALPFNCSAVITDVDGTWVNDEKSLTARAASAVVELRASGIVFSIVTSLPGGGLSSKRAEATRAGGRAW